jgi:methylmalonyl-CoA mutase
MDELFKEFPPVSAADWKARLEKDLKGITFEQLSLSDRDGITIKPFYTREDTDRQPEPVVRHAGWSICSQITAIDAAKANRQALTELNNGASGLCFLIEGDIDPAVLLQGIALPYIYTQFKLSRYNPSFITALKAYGAGQGWSWEQAETFIAFDYIGHYLQQRVTDLKKEEAEFRAFLDATEGMSPVSIDAAMYQNAGATAAYGLACMLAHVNEYLNLMESRKGLEKIPRLHITLAAGTAFFEQIAQLRACRLLLRLLLEAYGIQPEIHLHLETGMSYRAPFDSYSNLLRDSIAAMGAVIGGCNSLYIHPFDETLKDPNDFSRRMSRNQQLIFKEESYLDKVADIAAGAYYLETLTDQIAEKAWLEFKAIEQEGGLIAAFDKGIIKTTLQQQAAQLVEEYREGKRVLIGVNKFPNPKDEPKSLPQAAQDSKGISPLQLFREII